MVELHRHRASTRLAFHPDEQDCVRKFIEHAAAASAHFADDKGSIGTSGATGRIRGIPSSDSLRIVERFTRTDPKTIEYEVTIDDPKESIKGLPDNAFSAAPVRKPPVKKKAVAKKKKPAKAPPKRRAAG